jgi:hypothetical protein
VHKGSTQTNKISVKGSIQRSKRNQVCCGLAHRTVRCPTGQCPVQQVRTGLNQPLSGFRRCTPLKFTGLSGVPPNCPVHQRSNDYFVQRSTAKADEHRYNAWQKSEQKSETHWTMNRSCLVWHQTVPVPQEVNNANSRLLLNPNGWVTWRRTGQPIVPVRWRTGLSGAPFDSSLPQRLLGG